jgi:hypothetical protein
VETHDFEVRAVGDASLNYARLAKADHGELDGRELAERAQGFNASTQILDFGHGERCVLISGAGGALADVNQPILVAVDERLEEHAAHQREDGRVGADSQRQRQDHGDRKSFRPRERVERNSQVINECHDSLPSRKSVSPAIKATTTFASVLLHRREAI